MDEPIFNGPTCRHQGLARDEAAEASLMGHIYIGLLTTENIGFNGFEIEKGNQLL
jgi:hypothetical protein